MQPATPTRSPTTPLAHAWRDLLAREPKLRIRDAAARLDVPEAALRATRCGATTTRLVDDWPALLRRLPLLGEVMALTRNDSAVHEKIGEYTEPEISGTHALVHGGPIDLRIFLSRWAHGFAVAEDGRDSLHFFDAHGDAVHKIYSRDSTEPGELRMLVDIFRNEDQSPTIALSPRPARAPERPDREIDVDAFQAGWRGLRDTHAFFGLLRAHGVARLQAMRLAPAGFVRPVATGSIDALLHAAAATPALPIMVFVGNPGCLQIHTGPVAKIAPMGPWINVLDPGFNLHLRRDHVAHAWVVEKPTDDGIVTSLELFDARGDTIAMLFGERKPGRSERHEWRALLDNLATVEP